MDSRHLVSLSADTFCPQCPQESLLQPGHGPGCPGAQAAQAAHVLISLAAFSFPDWNAIRKSCPSFPLILLFSELFMSASQSLSVSRTEVHSFDVCSSSCTHMAPGRLARRRVSVWRTLHPFRGAMGNSRGQRETFPGLAVLGSLTGP